MIKILQRISVWLLVCFFAASAQGPLELTVEQVSTGDKHHFFGYIGQSLTIPWNASGRYILAIESDFHDHLPTAEEAGTVGIIDTENDNTYIPLDQTRGWNLQQGTMFFWNPDAPETQFFFNDRDEDDKVFTVLYDIEKRERIREYKFSDTPVGNGGVCPEGGFFLAINYARMARLRPVTGYPETWDWTVGEQAPDNDGIWKVDIATGEKELLVSFEEIAGILGETQADMYINHSLSSRKCERVYFFGRGNDGEKDQAVNKAFTMKSDGTGLKNVKYLGGHPEWYDEDKIIGRDGDRVVIFDLETEETVGQILGAGDFTDPVGDLSLSSNGKMFVNGWENSSSLNYHVVRLTDDANIETEALNRGPYSGGNVRIDGAPRWNRKGNKILIPGWVGGDNNGTRQIHLITVEGAVVDGCMDDTYLEYDDEANFEPNGACQTLKVTGCLDSAYAEYNPHANFHDAALCLTGIQVIRDNSLIGIDVSVRSFTVKVDYTGEYTIDVYDVSGKLTSAATGKGLYHHTFTGLKSSGIYFIHIKSREFKVIRKIMLF